MDSFGPATYGDGFADVYDEWYGEITDAAATTAFLATRAVDGPVLELGIGSGRLAAPMQEAGLSVIGVDASDAMLARCQLQHPSITTVRADLAHLPVRGPLGGALCAFNTLFNLPSEAAQQALFNTVASALSPGAPLVIEAITGRNLEAGPASSVGVSQLTVDQLVLSATVLDHEAQTITGQHVEISEAGGVRMRPWLLRWTTPNQLDRLASNAGLVLAERYGGWDGQPFNDDADSHVSVYQPTT